jgi:hypothetical protein
MPAKKMRPSLITWHIFWDLQCPYARQHWHQHRHVLANAFREQYDFQIHLTSLAFHAQAFPGQCAAYLLEQEKGPDAKMQFIDACFEHQHEYTNTALPDPTKSEIKRAFANIAQRAGLLDECDLRGPADNKLSYDDFLTRMDDWETVVKPAYAEHKIALGYGVFGTPKHVIHGKLIPGTESTWGVDEWKTKLDSLKTE